MKRCSTCKREKPREEFSKSRAAKDGLQSNCKSCTRKYRKANREAISAYHAEYYQANREAVLAKHDEHYKANREAVLAKQAEYYKANREVKLAKQAEYRKANREAISAYHKALHEATRAIALADRGGVCTHCGRGECTDGSGKFVKLHFHHTGRKNYTPSTHFSRGWDFVKDEVALTVLLCAGCHIKEHKRRAKKARETREAA